ncbi:MAG: T9SS type A sorting domain-containing protein [candidate division Zixibacteria bacterium]|nr:T9SS type A sorting domain-containing protein [candidate division Zixibacteria bacterium]
MSITLEGSTEPITGFNFLISYDNSDLSVLTVEPGEHLVSCGWEYFNYSFGPFANCEGGCPSGLLRITAIAETENGDSHPNCYGALNSDPIELTKICFLVSDTYDKMCQYAPVKFYWADCSDNVLASSSFDTVLVSNDLYDYTLVIPNTFGGTAITVKLTDSTFGFPTYYGIQDLCLIDTVGSMATPKRVVDFYNGGGRFLCAYDGNMWGDINLNGIRNEISDVVVFIRYFVLGLAAFTIHVVAQVTETEINGDGIPLTLSDLVYFIRIIIGDEIPPGKLAHNMKVATVSARAGIVSTDIPLGAAVFTLKGEVEVDLLADGMEMMTGLIDGDTRVIVYSIGKSKILAGPIISAEGEVISVEASDYYGSAITVAIRSTPTYFARLQNYPNPFNPRTTISFEIPARSITIVTIYDILGRIVRSYSLGELPPGSHSIDWDGTFQDGSSVASGVYFYQLRSGNFIETKKMVLLK